MEVKIKRLHPDAVIPKYSKPGDAGMDLTATSMNFDDNTGCIIYGTGLAVEIPEGYVGLVFPRSSVYKTDLDLTNCVGVIDSGYRGEIKAVFKTRQISIVPKKFLHKICCVFNNRFYMWYFEKFKKGVPIVSTNHHANDSVYKIGDRIAQLIIMPYPKVKFIEFDELSSTERGEGGYGSTGK